MTTTVSPDAPAAPSASSAAGVAWDLGDLYAGLDDPRIDQDLQAALKRAEAFETAYRGKINAPGGPAADLLAAAMHELEGLSEQRDKPLVYASLTHAAKSDDPQRGALLSRTREQAVAVNQHLIFFDLEWVHLPDEAVKPLLDSPALARYRHYLDQKRAWRPHFLTEPEEKIHDEKAITGRAAFARLFEETVSSMECPVKHGRKEELLSLQLTLAKLYDPDRKVRKAAAEGLTRGLQANSRLLTFIFNNVVLDHQTDCRLRKFPDPMASRHLANEIKPEVVDALMKATERGQKTVHATTVSRPGCWACGPCMTTTATPRCSRTRRPATGRRAGASSRKATRRSAPRPERSSASSSTGAGSTPNCDPASAAAPSAAAPSPAPIPTSS